MIVVVVVERVRRNVVVHTESYNNFLPGAPIHLCKQTQISPLTVDY